MYSRDYAGQELQFEASGGLMNSSLVMQDKQTDTYWSIMQGKAVGGRLSGTGLIELPYGEKLRWGDWKQRYPDTLVLSVGGREWTSDLYADYWELSVGFRGQRAADERLDTKTPIYAFELGGSKYAVPHSRIEGGAQFLMPDGSSVLLYREPGSAMFASTAAFVSRSGFEQDEGTWVERSTGARFDATAGKLTSGHLERLGGFDTFWYNWSLNNPDTGLLR